MQACTAQRTCRACLLKRQLSRLLPPRPLFQVQCYAQVSHGACLKGAAAAAAGFGYLLPTAGLRFLEQRSRSLFASWLQAAAAHES